jgi:hypothetical protein
MSLQNNFSCVIDFTKEWDISVFSSSEDKQALAENIQSLSQVHHDFENSLNACLEWYQPLARGYLAWNNFFVEKLRVMKTVIDSNYSSSSCISAISTLRSLKTKFSLQKGKLDNSFSDSILAKKSMLKQLADLYGSEFKPDESNITLQAGVLLDSLSLFIWSESLRCLCDFGKNIHIESPLLSIIPKNSYYRHFSEKIQLIDDHPNLLQFHMIINFAFATSEVLYKLHGETDETFSNTWSKMSQNMLIISDIYSLVTGKMFLVLCSLLNRKDSISDIIKIGKF